MGRGGAAEGRGGWSRAVRGGLWAAALVGGLLAGCHGGEGAWPLVQQVVCTRPPGALAQRLGLTRLGRVAADAERKLWLTVAPGGTRLARFDGVPADAPCTDPPAAGEAWWRFHTTPAVALHLGPESARLFAVSPHAGCPVAWPLLRAGEAELTGPVIAEARLARTCEGEEEVAPDAADAAAAAVTGDFAAPAGDERLIARPDGFALQGADGAALGDYTTDDEDWSCGVEGGSLDVTVSLHEGPGGRWLHLERRAEQGWIQGGRQVSETAQLALGSGGALVLRRLERTTEESSDGEGGHGGRTESTLVVERRDPLPGGALLVFARSEETRREEEVTLADDGDEERFSRTEESARTDWRWAVETDAGAVELASGGEETEAARCE